MYYLDEPSLNLIGYGHFGLKFEIGFVLVACSILDFLIALMVDSHKKMDLG